MLLDKQKLVYLAACAGFGLGLHFLVQKNLEQREERQRVWRQHETSNILGRGSSSTAASDQGPSKRAVQDMLIGLKAKSTREKLEAAVDAAHKTHGIGFPNTETDSIKEASGASKAR